MILLFLKSVKLHPVLPPPRQVDLEKTKRISGIVTQGAKDFGVVQFVSVFKVAYSNDGESWSTVKEENDGNDKVRFHKTAKLRINVSFLLVVFLARVPSAEP